MGGRGNSSGMSDINSKLDSMQTVDYFGNPKDGTNMIRVPFPLNTDPDDLYPLGYDDGYLQFLGNVRQLEYDEENIPLSKIITIQPVVDKDGVRKSVDSVEPIDVVLVNGNYYMYNGNHRATAAKLQGRKTISARVRKR